MYYRTDRTIAVRGVTGSEVDVRTYTDAESAAEARSLSRQEALDAVHPGKDKEIVGLETVVDVPGIRSAQHPEIRTDGLWHPISSTASQQMPLKKLPPSD